MTDDPKPTWTDREIVLELFPATHERLVPRPLRYRTLDGGDGTLRIIDRRGGTVADLAPVAPSGNPTGHLCCDLCQSVSTRRFLGLYRAAVPGSGGRRYRYLSACRDHAACETRRLSDAGIEALLAPDA